MAKKSKKVVSVRDNPKLPLIKQNRILAEIRDLVISGETKSNIRTLLVFREEITIEEFEKLYLRAANEFKKILLDVEDLKDVVQIHVLHYERIYEFFDSIKNTTGKRRAMLLKERLLGFHKESISIEINQNNIVVEEVEYNLDILTVEEKKRFQELVEKTQK